jgi:biotin carboxyl carrier protein
VRDGQTLHLAVDGSGFAFEAASPWPQDATRSDPSRAHAPVAGTLARLAVAAGERVAAGQPLACVEAMKMELWLHAAAAGTVKALHRAAGSPVAAGDLIVELELDA